MNYLTVTIKSTYCNGWPQLKLWLNQNLIDHVQIDKELTTVKIHVPNHSGRHVIKLERYGKESCHMVIKNNQIVQDQMFEILNMCVDGVQIPAWFLWDQSQLEIDNQFHKSLVGGPNCTWHFEFETPLLTFILDCKIKHEAKYNQDYLLPWSYKLGPDSVDSLRNDLLSAINLVEQKL